MNKDNTHSFKDAFKKFLKEEDLDKTYNEKRLIAMWNKVLGPAIANRTSRLFIKNRILFVKLSSAPLKQELTQSKQKVIDLIDQQVGEGIIDDVRFL